MRIPAIAACVVAALVAGGCAKWPDTGGGADGLRLTFTLKVGAEIDPNYVYIVAVNPSTDETPVVQGPIPVIAPPWGNGFVSGTSTHFVLYDGFQSPPIQVYRFNNPNLLEYFAIGVPANEDPVLPESRQIRFEIELSQIAGGSLPEDLKSIQINFLTMNVVPQGAGGDKVWDALGDGNLPSQINDYVTIPLRTGIYNNASFQFREPNNDCIVPALDIVDWQVEIRN